MNIPKISFSTKVANGSITDRNRQIKKLNQEIFNKIICLYNDTDRVPLRKIEKIYKSMLPEPVYMSIKSLQNTNDKTKGLMETILENGKITEYKISILIEKAQLTIDKLSVFLHESSHLLDYLFKPSYRNNFKKLNIHEHSEAVDLFDNAYYKEEINNSFFVKRRVKSATKQTLNGLSTKDKLLILNFLKNSVQTEIDAYEEGEKYAKHLFLMGRKYDYTDLYYKSAFMFEDKLKVVKKLILQTIRKERYENALKQSSGFKDRLKLAYKYHIKSEIG